MAHERRQLAAVLLTDMVGYSALTQRNESMALELVKEHERLVFPLVTTHHGRAIKSLGDGVLAEFVSATDAVECALRIQEAVSQRNAGARGERLALRIGVHLGDVLHRGGDVFGDAVNIVARIEPLAEAGGVCISQPVYDQVRNKLSVPFVSIGTPALKNIETPIQVYRLGGAGNPASASPFLAKSLVAGGPPRIAVLPFNNISPDPNDEFFADGMTEELIGQLSHVSGLRVIARTTTMHYKNSQETALEIGRHLQVGMVAECSVRKAGNRVRITAQLIDTASEEHLWAGKFDRDLVDIFGVQDEIAGEIAHAISLHVSGRTIEGTVHFEGSQRATRDMTAYIDFLRGRRLQSAKGSERSLQEALGFFERALERDPAFARARAAAADAVLWLGGEGAIPLVESVQRSRRELERALQDDPTLAEAHSTLAMLALGNDELEVAEAEARAAIRLNPSLSDPYRPLAQLRAGAGHLDEAVALLEEAHRLDPLDINVVAFLGHMYFYSGRAAAAAEFWARTRPLVPFRTEANLAEYYLSRGELSEAEASVLEMERLRPGNPWATMYRGFLGARRGEGAAARQAIQTLEGQAPGAPMNWFLAGFVHFAVGDLDAYFDRLNRSIDSNSLPRLEVLYSPLFASVRDDPRTQALLDRTPPKPVA